MATSSEYGLQNGSAKTSEVPKYDPVDYHWFYKQENGNKIVWEPFSKKDSQNLERAFASGGASSGNIIPTDGARYDVNLESKTRKPVYWDGPENEVRRCSWFHKGPIDGHYIPYEEEVAKKLEEEYKTAMEANEWHKKVEILNGDTVVFHDQNVLVLFPKTSPAWTTSQADVKPKIVKRGIHDFNIQEGESEEIDHVLFLVHGIGPVCDLKFRPVEETVEDFRTIASQLIQTHYKSAVETGLVNRMEVLPISWHSALHSEATGIDEKVKRLTLDSIPRLREFGQTTLLDILLYTSPCYCQVIIWQVANELNRLYNIFTERNPRFKGSVSLGGHSLGSVILFDLLCHQHLKPEDTIDESEDGNVVPPLKSRTKKQITRRISYMMTKAGIGQAQVQYPRLDFNPSAFFALGSPIGMLVTVRGLDQLGEDFRLPTCPAFFNIFHPYDPIAYRIEPLINQSTSEVKPLLIPHHKGRKRMHLELKEQVVRVGTGLKQRIVDSLRTTVNTLYNFPAGSASSVPQEEPIQETETVEEEEEECSEHVYSFGTLNRGQRIDYVLQEAPHEFINDYIFALVSHVCYWASEDTILMILKETYSSMGVEADQKIPQQNMTIERPTNRPQTPEN